MIRRWLLARFELDIRELVRDEVDLALVELGVDERVITQAVEAQVAAAMDAIADSIGRQGG